MKHKLTRSNRPNTGRGIKNMKIKSVFPNSEEAVSDFLASTREEMFNALELFHNHVKYTVSLMFSLLTAVFATFGFSGSSNLQNMGISRELFQLIASAILFLLFPLSIISILIIGRYYKLYVSALVFAAEAHKSVGLGDNHLWFREIYKHKQRLGKHFSEDKLIAQRTYGWLHSWILYSILIGIIGLVGIFTGIMILLNG